MDTSPGIFTNHQNKACLRTYMYKDVYIYNILIFKKMVYHADSMSTYVSHPIEASFDVWYLSTRYSRARCYLYDSPGVSVGFPCYESEL